MTRDDDKQAPSSPWRRRIAVALLVAGRVLLVAAPLSVVVCRATRAVWSDAPDDGGGVPDHWIPETTLGILFVFSLAFLPLVLPMGSAALATTTGTELRLRTVLGGRRIDLATARRSVLVLPGRGGDTAVLVLRDARHRWMAVASSDIWEPQPERPRPGSRRRLGQVAVGWGALAVIVLVAIVVFGALGAAAGVV